MWKLARSESMLRVDGDACGCISSELIKKGAKNESNHADVVTVKTTYFGG